MEQSVSEAVAGNKRSVSIRMRCVLALDNPSAVQISLCNVQLTFKSTRGFAAHPPRKKNDFATLKRDTLRLASSATGHVAGSERPPAIGLWKYVNVNGLLDGSRSRLVISSQDSEQVSHTVPTNLLRRFSEAVAEHCCAEDEVDFHIPGFSKQIVRIVVSFLHGEKGTSFQWIDDLALPIRVDLAMLSYHLDILPLWCATLESLHRALIGDGNWPNWAMLIHVWAVSDPSDPLRRLMLSSLYLNVIALGGTLKLPGKGREPDIHDYEEDMWLSDLHEFLDSYLMVDKLEHPHGWRSFNEAWHPKFFKIKFRLDLPIGPARSFRASGLLRDDSFNFTDATTSLRERLASFDNSFYLPDDEFVDIPSLLDTPEQGAVQSAPGSQMKRKLDNTHSTSSPRPSKSARLGTVAEQESDTTQELEINAEPEMVKVQCRKDCVLVERHPLISVSSVARKRLAKFPRVTLLSFREIQSCDLQTLIENAKDIDAVEVECKERNVFSVRALIGIIAAAEYLDIPILETRLLEILKSFFKKLTMDIETCQWIFDNTPCASSKPAIFAGECMHWVAMKNGRSGWAAWHDLCYNMGTALVSLFDQMEALQEEYGKMYEEGKAVEAVEQGRKEKQGKEPGAKKSDEGVEEGEEGKEVVRGQRGEGKGRVSSEKGEEYVAVSDGNGKGEEEVSEETEGRREGEREARAPLRGNGVEVGSFGSEGTEVEVKEGPGRCLLLFLEIPEIDKVDI